MKTNYRYLIGLTFASNEEKTCDLTNMINSPRGLGGMASFRLQLAPAVKAAQIMGIKPRILSLREPIKKITLGDHLKKNKYIVVIGKMSANSESLVQQMIHANLPTIQSLKRSGHKIVLQYSDHLLQEKNILGEFYRDLFALSDLIVYSSEALRNFCSSTVPASCRTKVISDPWQVAKWHSPRLLSREEACKLIWFGANKNIPYLQKTLPSLIKQNNKRRFQLTILGQIEALSLIKKTIKKCESAHNWTFRLLLWNPKNQPEQLEKELIHSHICVIPSDPLDPRKAGVSHNRLVDAIRAGCLAIANPMPSYLELQDLALLGENLGNLLQQAVQNYDVITNTISSKREQHLQRFSPEHNLQCWRNTLEDLISDSPDRTG